MSPILNLIFIFAIILAILIAKKFFAERTEERLRDNPPQRRIIEISLPNGITESRVAMKRFWKKMGKVAATDTKGRKEGAGQIDVVYLATVPGEKAMPVIKCLIYADPDKMDAIKRSAKQVFDAQSDIMELSEDPLGPYADKLRQIEHIDQDPDQIDLEEAAQ